MRYPYFEGDLPDFCFCFKNLKFKDYCITHYLKQDFLHVDTFITFTHDQKKPLNLDRLLEIPAEELTTKLCTHLLPIDSETQDPCSFMIQTIT